MSVNYEKGQKYDVFYSLFPFPVIVAGLATPAVAGSQTGTVTAVSIYNNGGPYIFMLSGTHGSQPDCASDAYWAIRISRPTMQNR